MRPSSYPLFETVALRHFLEAIAVTWSFLLTNTVFSYPPTSDPPLRLCHHRPAGRRLATGGPAGKHVLHASSTWVQKSLIAFSGASVSGETHGNVNLSFSWLTYQICSNKTSLPCRRIFLLSLFVGNFLIPLFMFILGLTEEVEGSVEGKYNGEWLLDWLPMFLWHPPWP